MKPATLFIHPDEKAMSLREINLIRPPTYQWHRWQIVTVNRGDALSEWWKDLGPKSNFPRPELEIPSFWEHSVAELQDMAQHYRLQDDYWRKFALEQAAESSLITDWTEQVEERREVINNRSKFGPGYTKQRVGFSRKAAMNEHSH